MAVRPGLEDFFEWIHERRSAGAIEGPWVFTTSSPKFAKAVLKRIDQGGRIFSMRVLTSEACNPASLPGFLLKDLDRVPPAGATDTRRKVLVDNNPVSHVLNPDNAVLVRDWLGDNPSDTELARVQSLLEDVLACRDGSTTGNYTASLTRATRGHDDFRERLQALRDQLAAAPPTEVPSLRAALRAIASECNNIKQRLLGGAP